MKTSEQKKQALPQLRWLLTIVVNLFAMSLSAQSIFTVTKTTDPDPSIYIYDNNDLLCDPAMLGTLHWAINKANDAGGASEIRFNIPGAAPHQIDLTWDLPEVHAPITIDGNTQPLNGYSGSEKRIFIKNPDENHGLFDFHVDGNVIRNLAIEGKTSPVIFWSSNNLIEYCKVSKTGFSAEEGLVTLKQWDPSTPPHENNIIQYNVLQGPTPDLSAPYDKMGARGGVVIFHGKNTLIKGNTIIDMYMGVVGDDAISSQIPGLVEEYVNTHITENLIIGTRNTYLPGISDDPQGVGTSNFKATSIIAQGYPKPVITGYNNLVVTGTAQPNDIIEVFGADVEEESNVYYTTVTADASGNWSATIPNPTYRYVSVTATQNAGVQAGDRPNTSAMASYVVFPCSELYFCHSKVTCFGKETYFMNSSSIGTENSTLLWDFGDGSPIVSNNSSTPSHIYATPGTYTVTLSTNQTASCPAQSITSTILVLQNCSNPCEFNSVVISASLASVCEGAPTVLTATGAQTYTWTAANGLSVVTTGETVTVTPTVTTTYTVTANTLGGCVQTQTITITINAPPVITVNNPSPICNGSSTILSANGAVSYTWEPNTWPKSGLSSTTGQTVMVSPGASRVYTVTGTDANGCIGTNTVSVDVFANCGPACVD